MSKNIALTLLALFALMGTVCGTLRLNTVSMSTDGKLAQFEMSYSGDKEEVNTTEIVGMTMTWIGVAMTNPEVETGLMVMNNLTSHETETITVNFNEMRMDANVTAMVNQIENSVPKVI